MFSIQEKLIYMVLFKGWHVLVGSITCTSNENSWYMSKWSYLTMNNVKYYPVANGLSIQIKDELT